MKLSRNFFEQPTLQVAEQLLGKILVFNSYKIIINETEAYFGLDDPASHAFRGLTDRTRIMFGPAGYSYVYLIYGMYYCLNFSTEKDGFPAAVLIRGGIDLETKQKFNGPGKLCRHLKITKLHNGLDIVESNNFYIEDHNNKPDFNMTPRIGIKVGIDKNWRFISKVNL